MKLQGECVLQVSFIQASRVNMSCMLGRKEYNIEYAEKRMYFTRRN